jgi:soluble lytic murein transglycosylase-like protein
MRITAIGLILLGCSILYDFTVPPSLNPLLLPLPHVPPQPAQPAVKRAVNAHAIIQSAARKHKVPAAFVSSIVAAESNFNPDALSAKGAVGLMQLMPSTAQQYGADPSVPEQNVDAGTRYLGSLLKRYCKYRNGLSRAIAAYNAGPGIVDRYRGVPPYRETRCYVSRVLAYLRHYRKFGLKRTAKALARRSAASAAD